MRPIHLELTAFGPYEACQAIDFAALGGSDLFLIHGPTGAGKTSIFDGITYALFGRLAGTRGVDRIRADRAAVDLRTKVVFKLRLGETGYRVERLAEWERPKRGGGTTIDGADATLWQDGAAEPIATGATKVTKRIEELLGMDQDQFTQVALLPQGEFKRLLCADSGERERLLQKLFATHRYVDIEKALDRRRKGLEERTETLSTQRAEVLRGAGLADAPPGALAEKRGLAATAAAEARDASAGKDAELAARQEALASAKEAQKSFDDLAHARSRHARAREAAVSVDADRGRVNRAAAAASIRGQLDEAWRAAKAVEEFAKESAVAEGNLATARKEAGAARADADALEAKRPQREALARRADLLQNALGDLDELRRREEVLRKARAEREKATDASGGKSAAVKEGEEAVARLQAEEGRLAPTAEQLAGCMDRATQLGELLRKARERDALAAGIARKQGEEALAVSEAQAASRAAELARSRAEEAATARERGMAGSLAAGLEPGRPCPVCGATEHPAPASRAAAGPDEQAVSRARAESGRLATEAAEAAAKAAAIAERVAELRKEALAAESLKQPVAELESSAKAADAALKDARSASDQLTNVRKGLMDARTEVERRRDALTEATALQAAAREALAKAEGARDELAARLASAGVGPEAKGELERLVAALKVAEEAAAEAGARREGRGRDEAAAIERANGARDALKRAVDAQAEAQRRAEEAAAATGFRTAAESTAALLRDEERTALVKSIEERVADERATAKVLDELEGALAGIAPPDVEAAQAARSGAAKDAKESRDEWVRLDGALDRLVKDERRVAELDAEAVAIEGELGVVGHVAKLVGGGNPMSMNLQRFVLAARLEEVAEAASARLLVMSKGRFRLRHDTAVARKNSAAGLSLVVEDSHTGVTDRPVGALSGGESFLASLSLALGLSDVVVAHAGGKRLDTLFVDEGFGSLDEGTLDVAIRALEELKASGRVVGIISHVAELRRRIPARIEVVPTERGAVATVHPA